MIAVSKNPRLGRNKIDEKAAEAAHEFQASAGMVVAEIHAGNVPADYYNPLSNLVALDYNGHTYWAYLIKTDNATPDPAVHSLIWMRSGKVDDIHQDKPIPDTMPPKMTISMALLIPKTDVPHEITSTSMAAMETGYIRDDSHKQKVYSGNNSPDQAKRTALVFNEDSGSVLLKGPGSDITLTEDGVHVNGKLVNSEMSSRSVMMENPISFLVPGTVVTFPASLSHLPDINKIQNIGSMMASLNSLRSLADLF